MVLEHLHFPFIPKNDLLPCVKLVVCWLLPKEASCEGFKEEAVCYHNSLVAQPAMQTKCSALCIEEEHLMFMSDEISYPFGKHNDTTWYLGTKS